MSIQDVSTAFKSLSQEDKAVLKQLQAEETARTGVAVSLRDIIEAVTPGMATPAYLLK